MNVLNKAAILGIAMLPAMAQAEVKFGGEAVLGYGEIDGKGDGYGILSLTGTDTYEFDSGVKLTWNLRARGRTDQDDIGQVDDNNLDGSVEIDFGAGGKFGLTTFNDFGQYPWADGDLYNRGSVGVFPVIKKRYDGVADSQFNSKREKVDPDLLLTYSNRIGKVGVDIVANPMATWDGNEESEMAGKFPTLEGKLTLPTKMGIYSIAYNNVEDAELQAVFPVRSLGVTIIGRRSINEGDWSDARNNLAVMYRAKNMGVFKGLMLAHAWDDAANRTMLNLAFGGEKWEVKVAGDSDKDFAVEGSYAFTDKASFKFGWDNGHDFREGFSDASFPAPVFAPARKSAFEAAFVYKF